MLRLLAVAVGLTLAACGTSSSSDVFTGTPAETNSAPQDASTDDAASASGVTPDDGASSDAGAPHASGPPRDAGDGCARLLAEVDHLRVEATGCSITSLAPKCNALVDDLCCKVVATKDTQATKNFEAAIKAFESAKCSIDCSNAICPDAPSNTCQAMFGTNGTCQQ
jgi:hypothetical protein